MHVQLELYASLMEYLPPHAERHRVSVDVSDEEMEQRRSGWVMPPYKATRGTLYKYIKNVKDASQGCVTDE